ncbi:MAG: hypothetical protein OHK0039_02250 [Bacteroidia bacterium]
MKVIALILGVLLSSPLPKGDDTDKPTPTGREDYYKYEQEDVSLYRDRVNFALPEPSVIAVEMPSQSPQAIRLSGYFRDGRKYHVAADQQLPKMVAHHKNIGRNTETLPGYRIQIYRGSSRSTAMARREEFQTRYEDQAIYLTFQSPNYILRIGDFLDEETALLYARQLQEVFTGAFLVPDKVKVPRYNDWIGQEEDDTETDNDD